MLDVSDVRVDEELEDRFELIEETELLLELLLDNEKLVEADDIVLDVSDEIVERLDELDVLCVLLVLSDNAPPDDLDDVLDEGVLELNEDAVFDDDDNDDLLDEFDDKVSDKELDESDDAVTSTNPLSVILSNSTDANGTGA